MVVRAVVGAVASVTRPRGVGEQPFEELQRGGVCPVQILDHEHQWAVLGRRSQDVGHRVEHREAAVTGQGALSLASSFQRTQDTLYSLSKDTGGNAMFDYNDLSLGIVRAAESLIHHEEPTLLEQMCMQAEPVVTRPGARARWAGRDLTPRRPPQSPAPLVPPAPRTHRSPRRCSHPG